MPAPTTLVIGAGIAGMTCARRLADAGRRVTVIDKGRRPSGRLSTRTSRSGPVFDHGAQFFTARLDAFGVQLQDWKDRGIATRWDANIVDLNNGQATPTQRQATRWVGTPTMDTLVADLCRPHPQIDGPHFGVRASELLAGDHGYRVVADGDGQAPTQIFEHVVVAIPGAQAQALVANAHPGFAEQLADTTAAACWAAMLAIDVPLGLDFDAAFVEGDGPLSWIACNTTKPGRPAAPECWVLHGGPDWSQANVDREPDAVLPEMMGAFADATGVTVLNPAYAAARRWRFAHVTQALDAPYLHSSPRRLSLCGDVFCTGSRPNIEQAWRSGHELAGKILDAK